MELKFQEIATQFFSVFSAALLISGVVSTPARADEGAAAGSQQVVVKIRTVRASDAFDSGSKAAVVGEVALDKVAATSNEQVLDDGLDDIGTKLKKLHYKKFTLICSQQTTVPLMKKKTVYLQEGNSVTVRPLYVDSDKVGLWLRWLDGAGTRVLDTRMHFQEGEAMLTGTEVTGANGNSDTGLVLAIEVHPVR